ncbi:MAG: BamA/TamA family outer membrane protein [Bacteroidota bacterium]
MKNRLFPFLQILLLGLISLGTFSCNVSRFVPKDQYILKRDPSVKHGNVIPVEKYLEGIQSKGNRRVVVSRLGLRTHNFGKRLEKLWYNNHSIDTLDTWWARRVKGLQYNLGEPPQIMDTALLNRDKQRLRNICFANGYFHPNINYQIDTLGGLKRNKRQTKVTFTIEEGLPYKIKNVQFVIDQLNKDSSLIRTQYFRKKEERLIKSGLIYSHDLFERERERATEQSRIGGFYSFEPSLINFVIDTSLAENRAIDSLPSAEKRYKFLNVDIHVKESRPVFKVASVEFQVLSPQSLRPKDMTALSAANLTQEKRDELNLSQADFSDDLKVDFLISSSILNKINYNFLANRIKTKIGQNFSLKEDRQTRQLLRQLGMFQYLLVRYEQLTDRPNQLKMIIEARLLPQYEVKLGLEAFTNVAAVTSNLTPNAGAKISLRNKNTLKQSELLDLNLIGNVGYNLDPNDDPRNNFISYQFGAEASMQFYRFLFAKPLLNFLPSYRDRIDDYRPITTLSSSINFRRFNGINQIIPGARLSYQWSHFPSDPNRAVSRLSPLVVTYFDPQLNENTLITDALRGSRIQNWDFNERLTSRLSYSYTQQNYRESRDKTTYWFQVAGEYGGLLPHLIERFNFSQDNDRGPDTLNSIIEWFSDKEPPIDQRVVDSIHYGFYGKLSLEGKIFKPLNDRMDFVVRAKVGASAPFFLTNVVPKEGRFFVGGVNGLRAWQANVLGPGITRLSDFGLDETELGTYGPIIATGGDYMFEANAEFRMRTISWIELAVFTDVGNVWLNRRSAQALLPDNNWQKATLTQNNFKLAWDAGMGVRFDLAYLILRLDFGLILFDPQTYDPENNISGWQVRLRQSTILPGGFNPLPSIGLNYPF